MIVHRCFLHDAEARTRAQGGGMWFPRRFQGRGRHDNPDVYGCLYVSTEQVPAVAELLALHRRRALDKAMLSLYGMPYAIAAIELADDAPLVDLDEPRVLARERLRPSLVATRERELTQPQALRLHRDHPDAAGLRWWSRFESQWINLTVFDRAARKLDLLAVRRLVVDDPVVLEAAELLEMT